MTRNLVSTAALLEGRASRLRALMEREFPEAEVVGHEHLVDAMPNHPKGRHVVAAAVTAGAQVITAANLKDFAALPDGLEAQSPDEFLCNIVDLDPLGFDELLREQAADLVKPPMSFDGLLVRLARVPEFVDGVRRHASTRTE